MMLEGILEFVVSQSSEFIFAFVLGCVFGGMIVYMFLLPRMVKAATQGLQDRIAHLEQQIDVLQEELKPYRDFAEAQIKKALREDLGAS